MTTRAATAIVYPETDGMPLPGGRIPIAAVPQDCGRHRRTLQGRPGRARERKHFPVLHPGQSPPFRLSRLLRGLRSVGGRAEIAVSGGEQHVPVVGGWQGPRLRPRDRLREYRGRRPGPEEGSVRRAWGERILEIRRDRRRVLRRAACGEYLQDGEYHRFELRHESDGRVWAHSDILNLDIWWTDGGPAFLGPCGGALAAEARRRA